jgi:prepilin-type N-terminal cleavage/methylation domain-containing protein
MNCGTDTRARTRLPPGGFTLVEVLVVITIIGILAALITVAAVGALKHTRRATIKSEIEQIDAAFEQLKNKYDEYPPNCQMATPADPIFEHNYLRRYMKKVAPRHREPDALMVNLIGPSTDAIHFPRGAKPYGIRPSEAIVFWLGGFSDDPNYPISGKGGPSYIVAKNEDPINRTLDPIESRKRIYPFDVARLGPRGPDGFFEDRPHNHIEYLLNGQWHRINFWEYTPPQSDQPYLYFDVSRDKPDTNTDVPQVPVFGAKTLEWIYPLKRVFERDASGAPLSFKFANQGRFQILHCGLDNSWGDHINHFFHWPDKEHFRPYPGPEYQNYLRMDIDGDGEVSPEERKGMIVFPEGPWIDELGDTQVNFTTEMTVEDAQ